jgi:putative molybdopterin biosynthesis protein
VTAQDAAGARVAVGEVRGAWVAHRLPTVGTDAADGIVRSSRPGRTGVVEPLVDPDVLHRNVLVTGCAPVLGMLARRVEGRAAGTRATWIPGSSRRSLDLLEAGLIHVAGVHMAGADGPHDLEALLRARFPGEPLLIVNLTRWREGFVVAAGNPLDVRTAEELLRPGLRFAHREAGSGARGLVDDLLAASGAEDVALAGPEAAGHAEVAQLVRCGAADVGVAIESVALAAGLGFVPLAEERFDLVVPASAAASAPVARFLDALDDPSFRTEMAHLPGYDIGLCGHVTTLEAA